MDTLILPLKAQTLPVMRVSKVYVFFKRRFILDLFFWVKIHGSAVMRLLVINYFPVISVCFDVTFFFYHLLFLGVFYFENVNALNYDLDHPINLHFLRLKK